MKYSAKQIEAAEPKDKYQNESDEPADYEKHEVESAGRTLLDAEHIKKKPKLHGMAMDHLHKQKSAIESVTKKIGSMDELKAVAKKKIAES